MESKELHVLESDRMVLINCDEALLNAIVKGDKALSRYLGINVPEEWSEFGSGIFNYVLNQLKSEGAEPRWYSYLPVEKKGNVLIGTCGYKGRPDQYGVVEIGYEVAKGYRGKGYATEMAACLLNYAFQQEEIGAVQAHTLAEENASVMVLRKNGFKFIEEYHDDEDGVIWKWQKWRP